MRVKFLNPLDLRACVDGTWTLIAPLDCELEGLGFLRVPCGFNTDLASVPRLFWNIIPPFGSHEEAAVVHDWLYRNAGRVLVKGWEPPGSYPHFMPMLFSRRLADQVLLWGMEAFEVPAWKRFVIHRAVRWFGQSSFVASLTPLGEA